MSRSNVAVTGIVLMAGALGLALPVEAQTSEAPVNLFSGDTLGAEVGSSVLMRTPSSLTMVVETTGLIPGDIYTNWWVIFNNPEHCVGGCNAEDFANPDVMASVLFATGGTVGDNGLGHFAAHRRIGYRGVIVFGPGIMKPLTAEVHYVIRTHGPAIPGLVQSQISTLNGGCPSNPNFNFQVNGLPGGNTCSDPQAIVHPLP